MINEFNVDWKAVSF